MWDKEVMWEKEISINKVDMTVRDIQFVLIKELDDDELKEFIRSTLRCIELFKKLRESQNYEWIVIE